MRLEINTFRLVKIAGKAVSAAVGGLGSLTVGPNLVQAQDARKSLGAHGGVHKWAKTAASVLIATSVAPAMADNLNILYYSSSTAASGYTSFYSLGTPGSGDPSATTWSITQWAPGAAKPGGNFNALVVGSDAYDFSSLLSAFGTSLGGSSRVMITGQDADFHVTYGPGSGSFDGPRGFLRDAINWAGGSSGMGVVFLDTQTSTINSLGFSGLGTAGWGSDTVDIPSAYSAYPINTGLSSAGLSNWGTSSHEDWSGVDASQWTGINTDPQGAYVTLVSAATAGAGASGVSTPPVQTATDIDTAQGSYAAAGLAGGSLKPVFDGGTLQLDGTALGSTYGFKITSNGGTIDQAGQSASIDTPIADAAAAPGSLTIENSGAGGVLTLSGVNTYSGATTIGSGATLALAGAGSIASSSKVTDNGTFDISGTTSGASIRSLAGSGSVVLGSQALTLTNAADTFSGAIAGTGSVDIAGGTETFAGTNSYSGGTRIGAGATLNVAADANLGAATGGVTLDGGTLDTTASFGTGRDITLTANGGTLRTDAGTTLTAGGTVAGSGSLDKSADGTLVLAGSNTYAGGTHIHAGTVQVGSDANLGAASGAVNLDGGTLENTASFGTSRSIHVGADGGALDADAGTTLTLSGSVDGPGTLGKTGAGAVVVEGAVTGTGAIAVHGGTETLTGANTYTGSTTIDAGTTLALAGTGSIASSSGVVADGTFDIGSATAGVSVQTLSGVGNVLLGSNTLTLTNASGAFGGAIDGSGGVALSGGTEALYGANSYAGGTSLSNGAKVQVGADDNLGAAAGSLTLDGGTLQNKTSFSTQRDIALGVNGGTIESDAGTTLSDATGAVSGAGRLSKDGAGTLALGGTLSQTGGITVNGGTLVLAGNNSYSGGTTVDSGATLQVSADTNLGASSNNPLTLDGGTLHNTASFDTGRAITLGTNGGTVSTGAGTTLTDATGTVSGAGMLVKDGAGTLALGGTLSQAGGTTVNAGTLVLAGNNSYAGGTTVNNGAALQVSADANLGATSNNPLTLDGGTLHNTASFDTGRAIALGTNGGTIDTDAGTILSDATGAVSGAGTLVKDGAGTLALGGTLSQTGGTIINGGTLVLAGNNGYTGGTTVNNGATLQVSADANLGATSNNPLVLDGGTLQNTASFDTGRDIALGTHGGTVTSNAGTTLSDATGAVSGAGTLVKDGAGTLSLGGTLSQAGGTTANGGTLVLAGNNSYTGGTTVNAGATLQVSADTNLGATSNNPLVLDGGTLQNTASFSTGRDIALGANGGTIATAAGTTLAAAGVLSGTAGLTKTGAGSFALSSASTYTGATTIASGTLALTGSGSIAASSGISDDGVFDIAGLNGGTGIQTLSGSGAVALGTNALTLTNASGSFAGSIGGAGALAIAGGTETLSGANSYAGGTTVSGGATVNVSADANLGAASGTLTLANGTMQTTASFTTARDIALAGSGSIDVAAGTTVTDSTGAVSGSGTLVKNGSGQLALAGTLSHSGGVVVNDGVLQLSGANTYTGGSTLNGGTLRVATDGNLGAAGNGLTFNGGALQSTASFSTDRPVTVSAGGGAFSTDGNTTLTLNGPLSGSGSVVKKGSGTLVLAGDNAGGGTHTRGTGWTGGITVDGGLVQVTNPWALGWGDVAVNGGTINTQVSILTGQTIAVAGGSSINTDTGTTTTLTGNVVSAGGGSGCFVKSGQGTLNITGSATLASGTCVQQGTLRANGTLASDVWVDPGAMLGGAGKILGTVNVRGTLSPGNSPGYLTAAGTVTMAAGSTYQEDIAGTTPASAATPVGATGYYSTLHVTNNGQFVVDANSTLAPKLKNLFTAAEPGYGSTPYTPVLGDNFRFVTADGGIVGRFSTLTQPDGLASGTRFAAFYNADGSNSIDLMVVPTSYGSWLSGANRNTRSAAAALDSLLATDQAGAASATQDQLLYRTARQNVANLPGYVRGLSGEVHGALAAVSSQAGLALRDQVNRQLDGSAAEPKRKSALWIDVQGERGWWRSDDAASGFTADRAQFTVGADVWQLQDARAGLGFSHASTNVAAESGSGNVGEDTVFAYGQRGVGGFVFDGIAAYGHATFDSQRADPTGFSATLASSAKGHTALVGAGIRAPWQLAGGTLTPFARVTLQKVTRDASTEGTASPAALALARSSLAGARLVLGASGTSAVSDPLLAPATWRYSAGLGVDAGALAQPTVQASLAGAPMTISAPQAGRVFVQLGAAGTVRLSGQSYLYYGVTGEARKGQSAVGVQGGLRVSF